MADRRNGAERVSHAGNGMMIERKPGPPAWPRTDAPLRVAIIGWARLALQQFEGSGYNLAASELARGLAMSGHEVFYLAAGMRYRMFGGPRIRKREDWGGDTPGGVAPIRCFDLINSPNFSPSYWNFQNPVREASCPRETAAVIAWLGDVRADVVHAHSLEGYGLDLIAAIERSGRPVIVTPHNYWFVCQQVDLLHEEQRVCEDYRGGERCVGCLPAHSDRKVRIKRVGRELAERTVGKFGADVATAVFKKASPAMKRRWALLRGRVGPGRSPAPVAPEPDAAPGGGGGGGRTAGLADPGVAAGWRVEPDGDGLIRHGLRVLPGERPKAFDLMPQDQNERVLAGGAAGSGVHLKVLNDYGRRRIAGVGALNAATLVTPPSDFLRRVHVSMGVAEDRTRWVLLGLPHLDQINRRARQSPYYDRSPWDPDSATRPLRLAFFGTVRPNKGLAVLAQAVPMLDKAVRQRCHFLIRAQGFEWPFRKMLADYPEVSVFGGFDTYQLIPSGGEYDVGILAHIWMENSPIVMLEHLHAGKFVISPRLGGPVDWIEPPRNGLLFRPGDPESLAAEITRVATGAVGLPSAKEIHEVSRLQSFPAHVAEFEGIYRAAVDARRGGPVVAPAGCAAAAGAGV